MEKIFVYLTDLSGNIAYLIIFGILIACGLGFPLPEDIPLIATGYLIWDGTLTWTGALIVTLIGVLIGDSILFYLGRQMGMRILEQDKIKMFSPKKVRRTRAYFRKYGDKLVFFARFVAGVRAATFFMAGSMKMKFRDFIFLDGLAALLSVPLWITLGYGLGYWWGDQISEILKRVHHLKQGFRLLILTIVVGVLVQAYLRYRRAKRSVLGNKSATPS